MGIDLEYKKILIKENSEIENLVLGSLKESKINKRDYILNKKATIGKTENHIIMELNILSFAINTNHKYYSKLSKVLDKYIL